MGLEEEHVVRQYSRVIQEMILSILLVLTLGLLGLSSRDVLGLVVLLSEEASKCALLEQAA